MVSRTAPLGTLKKGLKQSIFPQIHQPLPLNRRESQQLLNSITSSFRKNLDKEHPVPTHDTTKATAKPNPNTSNPGDKVRPQRYRPTDSLVESILSNPLFTRPSNTVQQPIPATQPNHHDIFDSAVSKGLMSSLRAAGYLEAVRRELNATALDVPAGMAATGSGLRVVQWLRASGAEQSLVFLGDTALAPLLVSFMFAEGLEEVAWTWLSRLSSQLIALPKDGQTQRAMACLLYSIKTAQEFVNYSNKLTGGSLDKAYSNFLRAKQIVSPNDPIVSKNIRRYWHTLSWSSTVNASLHESPSAPLYEMFIDAGRPWRRDLDIAHLELHHPTNPSHSSALEYLHDKELPGAAARKQASPHYVERMISLGNDTVDRLQQVGDKNEASWVAEFMSRTFFAWNVKPEGNTPMTLNMPT